MAAQLGAEHHQYLSVSNYLENEGSDSSAESEPQDRFERLRARLSAHPRAAQRSVTASAVLAALVLVLVFVGHPAGRRSDGGAPPHAWNGNAKLRAVQLESTRLSMRPISKAANEPAPSVLTPADQMHDGNACDANEELYGGLCYKKCSLLTDGEAPIRTSSWSCCEGHPCGLGNQRGGVAGHILCSGFDVSGAEGCPHKPGACLLDEEMHLGMCYKKCSLLTGGKFAYRVAAATCCKTTGLGCMNILNDRTSEDFNVGGVAGTRGPLAPARAHPPTQSLTESAPPEEGATQSLASTTRLQGPEPEEPQRDVCGDAEELYGGLCYKTCSLLTEGEAPIRTSSWTCCKGHPCSLFNQLGSVGRTVLCNGFDVSASGSCPREPLACRADEEMHLGVCYLRCDILTKGEYPHRFAAATCCKAEGLGCLNPRNDMTRSAFAVGGGSSGGHEATDPSKPRVHASDLTRETLDAEVTALATA